MTTGDVESMITVSVAYAMPSEQFWRNTRIPAGSTIRHVIETSGILSEFPKIDLNVNKVGIFGQVATLDTPVQDADRVEIYRPIRIDPQQLPKRKYRLRKVEPLIESRSGTTKVGVPTNRKSVEHEDNAMTFAGSLSEYGFVVKVDVTDLDRSIAWYCEKLGFRLDERYSAGLWRQLVLDPLPKTALGLYLNPDGAGLGGKKATFVVDDIEGVRDRLIRAGVEVDEIITLGDWVKLAFLRDPDGNIFGIRESIDGGASG